MTNTEDKTNSKRPDREMIIKNLRGLVHLKEKAVFQVFQKAFQLYKPNEVMFSFNGGKDCTVVLHMLCKFYQKQCLKHLRIPVLYIQDEHAFPEMEAFVDDCGKVYHINLIKRRGKIKDALEAVCAELPEIKAVFMGCRRIDPFCANLQVMQVTDPGYPPLMRINPIIDWSCRDVWSYIFVNDVPYCSLYDRGYTSIGNRLNTKPNPHLRVVDKETKAVTYRHAYELPDDDSLERAGRF